ncbi:MAG: hypothetical protein KA004_10065 [Verrucomicrobiales bacterium]|nr:hypothetical protein [Verrucomicrobiales bacterium]
MIVFTYRCRNCKKRAPLDPVKPPEAQRCSHCHFPCEETPEAVRIERAHQPGLEEWEADADPAAATTAVESPVVRTQKADEVPAPTRLRRGERVCPKCRRSQYPNPATGEFPDVCPCGHSFVALPVPSLSAGGIKAPQKHRIPKLVADNWLLAMGLVIIAAVGAAFLLVKRQPQPTQTAETPQKEILWDDVAPVVQRFLTAKTPADLFAVARNPQKMEPEIRRWLAAGNSLPLAGSIDARSAPLWIGSHKVWEVQAMTANGPPFSFVVAHTPSGVFVDWPSMTGFEPGDLTLPELLRTRPETPRRVRVFLRPKNYYNGPFSDPKTHWSLVMTGPDDQQTAYAYAPKGSPAIANWVQRFFSRPVQQPATVLVKFPPGSKEGADQVEIAVVEGSGWYVP